MQSTSTENPSVESLPTEKQELYDDNSGVMTLEIPSEHVLKVTVYPYPDRQSVTFQDVKFWFSECNPIGAVLTKEKGLNSQFAYATYVIFKDKESFDTALTFDKNMISQDEYLVIQTREHTVSNVNGLSLTTGFFLELAGENVLSKSKYKSLSYVENSVPTRYKPRRRLTTEFPLAVKSFVGPLVGKNTEPEVKHTIQHQQNKVNVRILIPEDYPFDLPKYATSGSAGFDIQALVVGYLKIRPKEVVAVDTGLKVAIPPGYELQIRSRSGLALKDSIVVANSPGTIDSDYRGLIKVLLINHSEKEFVITNGMKVAQAVLCPVYQANFVKVESEEELGKTDRGEGGFGSTGL